MKLWLLRHAQVQLPAGLCYGASDVAADPALTEQAARHWTPSLPHAPGIWRTSALTRVRQLFLALQDCREIRQEATVDNRLNEMNFGQWELQAWDAIPRAAFDVWMTDFAHHRFGGEESTQMLLDRVAAALAQDIASGIDEAVWVTHAGVIRAVSYLAGGGRMPIPGVEAWPREAPAPGGAICLSI